MQPVPALFQHRVLSVWKVLIYGLSCARSPSLLYHKEIKNRKEFGDGKWTGEKTD